MAVTVVLAEDSFIVREGLAQVLAGSDGDIEVVALCDDYDSLLAAVEAHRPAVVVTDIRMPPTNTNDCIRIAAILRERHPEIGVVVLSNYADAAYALALLESGA